MSIFGKIGNTGEVIQGDNLAVHWFVLRDLGMIDKETFVRLSRFWPVRGRGRLSESVKNEIFGKI